MDEPKTPNHLPDSVEELFDALRQQVAWARDLSQDFRRRQINGPQEKALVYCLDHALDLSEGALLLSKKRLPDSQALIARALLESLFWARYVSLSAEKAEAFEAATLAELRRIARKNLGEGYARVVDSSTREDRTVEFLDCDEMQKIPRRMSIEEVANAGGLRRLYTNVYGFMSVYAHGVAYGFASDHDDESNVYASVSTSLGALQCINLITSDRVKSRRITSEATLSELLGVEVDAA